MPWKRLISKMRPGLLGELGERLAVEPCEFRAEVEVRGVELVGESLFQLLVDA